MTQPQREALLDLVILSIFTDSHLSIKEDEALENAFAAIGWEAEKPREIFICTSMSRARRAVDSATGESEYIRTRVAAFNDAAVQAFALDLLQKTLAADGTAESEAEFLAKVKAAFPAA